MSGTDLASIGATGGSTGNLIRTTLPTRSLSERRQVLTGAVVSSPNWARTVLVITCDEWGGFFDHGLYDHTSVLKMIEWRFGLAPLTVRDAGADNLASVLDFAALPVLSAPRYNVPVPLTLGCLLTDHAHSGEDWPDLLKLASERGFAVKPA
jgi:phospholipase C